MNSGFKIFFLSFIFFQFSLAVFAQTKDTSIFELPIEMDEVVVSAARGGWDVNAFIRRIKTDTTFYKAFRSLRLVNYSAINDIKIFDDKNRVKASLFSKTKQTYTHGCRSMQVFEEKTTGDFYKKNGGYNYYTAELYAYLMFTKGKICGETDIVADGLNEHGKGQMEKSKAQLKQLIFNPGSKVKGVPFMGDKASIFDADVSKLYNFSLSSVEYEGEDCYLFKVVPKKGNEKDVVFNELSTWFRKSDYSIVARNYSLSFNTMFYDFDVQMKVRLRNIDGKILPSRIEYQGNWKVAMKKREKSIFTTIFDY